MFVSLSFDYGCEWTRPSHTHARLRARPLKHRKGEKINISFHLSRQLSEIYAKYGCLQRSRRNSLSIQLCGKLAGQATQSAIRADKTHTHARMASLSLSSSANNSRDSHCCHAHAINIFLLRFRWHPILCAENAPSNWADECLVYRIEAWSFGPYCGRSEKTLARNVAVHKLLHKNVSKQGH